MAIDSETECLSARCEYAVAMTVIGIVGLPGSGKSEAATVAEEESIPVLTMGDVVRAEVRERGMEVNEDTMGEVATDLREKGGKAAIAERSLPIIEEFLEDNDTVLLDGIRGQAEVERFVAEYGEEFTLASIEVPFETRLERIQERGRDEAREGAADLRERDERELGYGLEDAMENADLTIDNTGTLEEFRQTARTLLTESADAVRKRRREQEA
jgi:dephospho-CoA kinase